MCDEGLHLLWDPTGKGIVQACSCEQDIQDQHLYLRPSAATQTRNMSIFMTKPSTKFPTMDGTIEHPRRTLNIAKF